MKHIFNIVIIAAIAFGFAYLFLEGWDLQAQIDGKRPAQVAGARVIVGDTRPLPDCFSGGRERTTGMDYYTRREDRGR